MRLTSVPLFVVLCLLSILPAYAAEEKKDPVQLAPVVVTSQKKEADKQKVPSNITVYDDVILNDLKIDAIEQLYTMTPNIGFVSTDSHFNQVTFRGIGGLANMNKVFNINVDGVPVPYVATDMLLDVERVEFLRGSQGSLYGRNTHAGVVNVHTKDPGTTDEVTASLSYGSFNTLRATTAFGTRLTDTLSYRLALAYNQTDGYFRNEFLDKDDSNRDEQITARGKLRLDTDTVGSFTFGLYADRFDGGYDSYSPSGKPASRTVENNETGYSDGHLFSPSLTWNWKIGDVEMTSITNYSSANDGFLFDWDYSRRDIMTGEFDENFGTFTQELRFTGGDSDGLQWLLGGFAMIEELDTSTDVVFHSDAGLYLMNPGDFMGQQSTIKTRTGAVFGQGIYRIFPQLELTAALRLDYEHKSMDWENNNNIALLGTGKLHAKRHWFAPSPSASLAWIFNEDQRVYASVGRGFKAGDYNNVMMEINLARNPVDPEYTTTYELGYKGRHFDNRLELNTSIFYIDWQDMQVDVQVPPGVGVFSQFEKMNAAEAHSIGMEIESRARLSQGWEVFGGLGYMFEYEFDDFAVSDTRNLKGHELPVTPKYTLTLGTTYRTDSGFFLSSDVAFRGQQYFDQDNKYEQDAYALLNAKIGYEAENWEAFLYGKNLTDANYTLFVTNGARMAGAPRALGAEVGIRF